MSAATEIVCAFLTVFSLAFVGCGALLVVACCIVRGVENARVRKTRREMREQLLEQIRDDEERARVRRDFAAIVAAFTVREKR